MGENESDHDKVIRLEERWKAAEKALSVAEDKLKTWESNANEWRKTINDMREKLVTRPELYTMIGLATAVTTFLSKVIR